MNVLIFGATGATGRQLVEQALAQGHATAAFVRDPANFDIRHANLQVVQGNVMNEASVDAAMPRRDAVIAALGTPAWTRNTVRSEGTRNILRAMEKHGVRRLVSLSSFGVGDSRETLPFLYKYIVVPWLLRQTFEDHALQESYVAASDTDWVIVRPSELTKGPHTGRFRIRMSTETIKEKISRADLADFMLRQLASDEYLRQTPLVSAG